MAFLVCTVMQKGVISRKTKPQSMRGQELRPLAVCDFSVHGEFSNSRFCPFVDFFFLLDFDLKA